MKSNSGYSLIEIAIGLAIITIFLLCTGSLVNASFTNYRLILQRNEALEFAINEMENVLQSDEVSVSDFGFTRNYMDARITIENVKNGSKIYDNVFIVTVNVAYSKTPQGEKEYSIELQSLKVIE